MNLKIVGSVVDYSNKHIEIEIDEDDIKNLIRDKAEKQGVKLYNGCYWVCSAPKIKEYYFCG